MEEVLKQILNKLDNIEKDVNGLKQGQESFKTEVESHFSHLEKAIHKNYFDLEKKIEQNSIELNTKLDRIYNNTDGIAKNFTDTTQEVTVTAHQVRGHEDRIAALEEKIA